MTTEENKQEQQATERLEYVIKADLKTLFRRLTDTLPEVSRLLAKERYEKRFSGSLYNLHLDIKVLLDLSYKLRDGVQEVGYQSGPKNMKKLVRVLSDEGKVLSPNALY